MRWIWITALSVFMLGCGRGDENLGKAAADVITQRDKVEAMQDAKQDINKVDEARQDDLDELNKF